MNDILEKISSYNIFNYIFPGILFSIIVELFTNYTLLIDNIFIGLFYYYFIGLVISRFGSLLIDPIFKKFKIVKYCEYDQYVNACKEDKKIELLAEFNNMYRTIIAAFIFALLAKPYEFIENEFPTITAYVFSVLILLLFVLAYRKQTRFINKRIEMKEGSK